MTAIRERPLQASDDLFVSYSLEAFGQVINGTVPQHLEWKARKAATKRSFLTRAEAVFHAKSRNEALGCPCRPQQLVAGYILDFYFPTRALLVDIDTEVHQYSQAQKDWDQIRDERLWKAGFATMRIPEGLILQEPEIVMRAVVEALG